MPLRGLPGALRRFAGIGANNTGHLEKWVSGGGGLTGILGVLLVSQAYLGLGGSTGLVASTGASAVLLFAVPHGPLSQPWPVFGGHLVCAVIGVGCAKLGAHPVLAAALAVALAISAMYYLRCIHPPGGATALTAVAGGDPVHALGFHYVLTPVLLNVLVILLVAMLFNWPFPWRRYPAAWALRQGRAATRAADARHTGTVARATTAGSAAAMDPPHDSTGAARNTAREPAAAGTEPGTLHPADIRAGRYYCNGAYGARWQVRQVIDAPVPATGDHGEDDILTYRIAAGSERRRLGAARRSVFARWGRYEVFLNENSWQRAGPARRRPAGDDAACIRNDRRMT